MKKFKYFGPLQIFLLVLIIIGLGLLITQKIWIPKFVQKIINEEDNKVEIGNAINTSYDYQSSKFGIAFNYKSEISKNAVMESGNRVYVYSDGISKPEDGQFVEVFYKNPKESLEEGIRKQILANFPSKDCKISINENRNNAAGLVTATIEYPEPDNPNEPFWQNMELCNSNYDVTNGIRYFAYDPKFPDRFFFFSIGQYAIQISENVLWQDNFKVLPLNNF